MTSTYVCPIATADPTQYEIFVGVRNERDRQDSKWGAIQNFDNRRMEKWLAILGEEVGEANRAVLEGDHDNLVTELTQVAAVAVSMLESLVRRKLTERTDATI